LPGAEGGTGRSQGTAPDANPEPINAPENGCQFYQRSCPGSTANDSPFTVWRYHVAFTDTPFVLVQAEEQHRGHAVIEQVFAELIDGPLAHLTSGRFDANPLSSAHTWCKSAGQEPEEVSPCLS
jgi:hypothetical protein